MHKRALKSLQRFAWVLLLALTCQIFWAKAENSEEEQERLVQKFTSNWIYVCQLLIVIVLSLLFEKGHDLLSEKFRNLGRQGQALNLMLDCLTNEIMILGFIGLLVYVATKTDVALALARMLYPKNLKLTESDDPLAETFETVHMIIFCVMVCFVSQVSLLMYKACYRELTKWRSWEHIRVGKFGKRDKQADQGFLSIANMMEDAGFEANKEMELEMNPLKRILSHSDVRDLIQWRLLRHDFMFPNTDLTMTKSQDSMEEKSLQPANQYSPREPHFFQFSMYLDTKMGETFVKLIEVDYATWGLMAFLSLFLPWVISFDQYWYSTIAAICSWSIVLCMFIFGVHVVDIYNKLTPQLPPDKDGKDSSTAQMFLVALKGTSAQALKGSHRRNQPPTPRNRDQGLSCSDFNPDASSPSGSPVLVTRDANSPSASPRLSDPLLKEKEHRELSHRFAKRNVKSQIWFPWLWKGGRPWYLLQMARLNLIKLNQAPNEQERFFFFHEASPQLYKHFIGDLLFLQSVVTSMYLVMYCVVDIEWGWFQSVVTAFGLCGPVLNLLWLVPKIVGKVVMIMSIEFMKDKHVVEDVVIENKRHQLLESIKILEFARIEGKLRRIMEENIEPEERNEKYSNVFDSFSRKKQDDFKKMFEMFDEDTSGSISKEEFNAVIMSMNMDVGQGNFLLEAADQLWGLVDEDGSGCVEWDEFRVLVAMVFHKETEHEEDDKALFHQFDEDMSGEITIPELTEGFKKLGVDLDDDCVASLVTQVFKKSKQKLKEDDFVTFMLGLEEMSERAE
mmetsp:Transcript_116419/g.184202  ORF Transcript_116419/g.184202 Transcript_116419/m.184202 type:complete len:790 (+) Transcript_116419:138-2507(+)